MTLKSVLNITFKEDEFKVPEAPQSFDKPEFKKFNMKFHNLDLMIIDAIAKRDGTSRAQIINMFTEQIIRNALIELPGYVALKIGEFADTICDEKGKTNKDFLWKHWVIEQIGRVRSHEELISEYYQNEGIDFGNRDTIPPDLVHLILTLQKHLKKLKETKFEAIAEMTNEH